MVLDVPHTLAKLSLDEMLWPYVLKGTLEHT